MTDDAFEPDGGGSAPPGEAAYTAAEIFGGYPAAEGVVPATSGRSTVGVVWQEGTPGHGIIKLCAVSNALPGEDVALGRAAASNHSPSISDRSSGISIAWIESPAGDTSGVGRVMLQRVTTSAVGRPMDAAALAAAANDNATWVADLSGAGAIGCEPAVTELATGDALVTWIGVDGHAHGRLYGPADEPAGVSRANDGSSAPEHAAANAALGDLGPVGVVPDGGRRLQVAELRPGAFAVMWLALGENGPVLHGNLFLTPAGLQEGDDGGGWTGYPIAEVRLPHGFAGQFSIAPASEQGAALEVTYSGLGGTTPVNIFVALDDAPGVGHAGKEFSPLDLAGLAAVAGEDRSAAARVAPDHESVERSHLPQDANEVQTPTPHSDSHAVPAKTALAIAANPLISETAPIVQAMQGGFAIAWQAPGSADGTQQVKLTLYDETGVPKGPEILVTDKADGDVAPAISDLGDGIAAAYVHADDGALVVEAYDGDGAQIGQDAVVDPGDSNAIVEIALGSNGEDGLAVVYVQQISDAGAEYGKIMLQRYGVGTEEDGRSQLVRLGRDGECDGTDAAVQLTVAGDDPTATGQPAVGRAPSVMGVDGGELGIIWVEGDGTHETIKGVVIDEDGGQVLRIDLTGLLEGAGIAKGTKPTLLDAGDGDLLVSWLQPEGDDGGYIVMSALYSEASPGAWLVPEQAVRLKAFSSEPKDYSVAISSDDGGLSINVIWREDSSGSGGDKVYSQSYDIDGQRLGLASTVAGDDALTDQQLEGNTLAAAGLLDGQIVVVYTEQDSDGDLDLAAHIIDAGAAAETGTSGESADAIDVADKTFSTGVDQEAVINPLADQVGAGLTISHVNDVPITTATPVDVGSAWVQLREDGWLTVTPDAGYTGGIAFDYTVAGGANGAEMQGHVVVDVEASEPPAAVTLLNQVIAVPEDASMDGDLKVADIAMADGELDTDGLSLTGLDAGMFKIVGSALYLKEGIALDFETKPTLSIEIQASHPSGFDGAASFTLSVESSGETPVSGQTGDTFLFAPGYGNAAGEHEIVDLRSTGYTTFQQLVDAGALVQAGDDVVITLNPDDPVHLQTITLRGVELAALGDSDFRFS